MTVSPERLNNAYEAYADDHSTKSTCRIASVLLADDAYRAAHPEPSEGEGEPTLPEGVFKTESFYRISGLPHGNEDCWIRDWVKPETLESIAKHMHYHERQKQAKPAVTDAMVDAAMNRWFVRSPKDQIDYVKLKENGYYVNEMRAAIQAALEARKP